MSHPVAEVEIRARNAGFEAGLREAGRLYRSFSDGVTRDNAKMQRSRGGKDFITHAAAQAVGNLTSSAVQRGAGFLEELGKTTYDYNDKLVRLGITAEESPAHVEEFNQAIRRASDETGVSKMSLVEAGAQFVALTGDMQGAKDQLRAWAVAAQATNSDVKDIASASAALGQQMKIDPSQMMDALQVLAIQGKKGAIELKDLAGGLSQIAPQWAQFANGRNVRGVQELGAALQIVKRGFGGDGQETITGLQSLLTALTKNAGKFEGWGVKVFEVKDGKKQFRDVLDIVKSIGDSKIVNDPTSLEKAFGRVEAYRAFVQLKENREELGRLITASGEAGVLQKDLDTYLNSTAGRTKLAWEQAKNKMAEVFTPERIENFGNALAHVLDLATKLVGALGDIQTWVERNTPDKDASRRGYIASAGKSDAEKIAKAAQLRLTGEALRNEAKSGPTEGLAILAGLGGMTEGVTAFDSIIDESKAQLEASQHLFKSVGENRGRDVWSGRAGSPSYGDIPGIMISKAGGASPDQLYGGLKSGAEGTKFEVVLKIGEDVLARAMVNADEARKKVAK